MNKINKHQLEIPIVSLANETDLLELENSFKVLADFYNRLPDEGQLFGFFYDLQTICKLRQVANK